ncbi:MAG: hypothetical protein IKF52_04010 [Clostridia bacterium]|nr:hypothetical protein [Clostridia bacterium]
MIVMDKDGNIFDERRKEDIEVENERREKDINEIGEKPSEDEEPKEKTVDDIKDDE